MASSNIIKINQFSSNNVTIDDNIRTTKYAGKSVYISYNKSPVRIQLPKLKVPFGVSRFVNPDNENDVKFSLDVTVTPEIANKIQEIEEKIIAFAVKNSKELFKKQLSEEVLRANFKSSLKHSMTDDGEIDTRYQPRLKTKIYNKGEELQVTTYGSTKENGKYPRIHVNNDNADEYFSKGSYIELIVQASPVWIVSGNFGVSFVASQAKVYPNENPLNSYAFQDDEDEDELEHTQEYAPEEPVEIAATPRRVREKF